MPVAVIPLPDDWTDPSASTFVFSPTQISTHIECARKWGWKRITKLYTPPNASAELGSRTHTVLEHYLEEGERPDFVKDRQAAKIATSGLHFLPEPKTPGMRIEREFHFKSTRTGFVYHGFKDVELEPGIPQPQLAQLVDPEVYRSEGFAIPAFDGSAPVVIDHKTTSSIDRYAKDIKGLQCDAQSAIYGLDSLAKFGATAVDLAWGYMQTKGPSIARPTVVRLQGPHIGRVFDAIESVAEEAATALTKNLQPLELPANPDACGLYGGCPYRQHCTDLGARGSSHLIRSLMSGSNSIIAGLAARVQGATASAPPPPTTEATPEKQPTLPGVAVNPPESTMSPDPTPAPAEEPKEKKPRRRVTRTEAPAAPSPAKDPLGADMHAAITSAPTDGGPAPTSMTASSDTQPTTTITNIHVQVTGLEDAKKELDTFVDDLARKRSSSGFTLYVDCLPMNQSVTAAASLIAKAQERMLIDGPRDAAGHPVPDYRLIDYGKGAPAFVSFFLDQVDGTFDLALDTRSPEGAVLLEPLTAKAGFVVRGFR